MNWNWLHTSAGLFLFLAFLIVIDSCAKNPVTGKREVMLMSESQEIALGKQSDPSIVAQFGLYQNQTLQNFISQKGKQMARISHRPNLPYSFKVLDSPVVNAFAVPGGFVYFTRGILGHFNNEAEFIGVLGHEIGHVTARHSAKQQSKSTLAQLGLVVGMIASPAIAQFGQQASQGLGLLFLKFGRDAETQSDQLGVEYSTKIGYDAHEMANFFQTLDRMRGGGEEIPTFLSTHPHPADRFNKVHALASKWQTATKQTNLKVNRDPYLRMIDGLVYGEDPRQGFVENNNFYHPEMKFQYPVPANWQVQNSPTQVGMAPSDGKAMMIFKLANESSLEASKNKIVQENGLTVINSRNLTIHGNQALGFLADQTGQDPNSGQQQSVRVLTYLIKYGANIYAFHGLTSPADFARYETYFVRTMEGFRALNDPAKINVTPDVIRVKTVNQTSSLSNVLKSYSIPTNKLEELAVLNGMKLTDNVKSGTLIKVIEKQGGGR